MFRSRSWFGGWGRPKNLHSLEHLKYLYNVMARNQTVSEHNRGLLVETLRSIAEILIWGDQNDSSVFDFFLEKNMLSFFLRIMGQRSGGSSYVCVQLLQTLNILFENIRNETSLYYLLSNNHVNSIIVHKFDFSDEEVMAYYISFLKTLSLKLNAHTIHFFYNEHTNDFPLYTEAIKFFNHSESMVRIAVRTLTLNVYRVEDASMLKFIRDRTAAPYFSNLVWFIGKHVLELDYCIRNDADHQSQNQLSDLVAEHLDHLHYLNDILCLNISDLNEVLTEHLLQKLIIPLYIQSLINTKYVTGTPFTDLIPNDQKSPGHSQHHRVSNVLALFLLSQIFLIITHPPLVHSLAWIILNGDSSVFKYGAQQLLETYQTQITTAITSTVNTASTSTANQNITDEEKQLLVVQSKDENEDTKVEVQEEPGLSTKPFLETLLNALSVHENDYSALFALCLLYALANNRGISPELLGPLFGSRGGGSVMLAEHLLNIISGACEATSKVRLVTLALSLRILQRVSTSMTEKQKTQLLEAKEHSTALLRNFYKSEEIFLDMFEHEYFDMSKGPLNVEWLCMDANILLPPTGTPMTGIEFTKRLPCGEVERARRAIRVFFLIRDLCINLNEEQESQLPLTNSQQCVQLNNVLDLNNSDLIGCTVVMKDGTKLRRFLVIDTFQLILVEPDSKKLGWGVAKLVGFLQDIEVIGDKDDSRCLHITIQRPLSSSTPSRVPLLSAKFLFDDHIRCMAAKQRLTKGRIKARQKKMQQIAKLLDIPGPTTISHSNLLSSPSSCSGLNSLGGLRGCQITNHLHRGNLSSLINDSPSTSRQRQQRDSLPGTAYRMSATAQRSRESSASRTRKERDKTLGRTPTDDLIFIDSFMSSREGSPRMPRPKSEEIPLELIKKTNTVPKPDDAVQQAAANTVRLSSRFLDEPTTQVIVENVTSEESEETSFMTTSRRSSANTIRPPQGGVRQKGHVETV